MSDLSKACDSSEPQTHMALNDADHLEKKIFRELETICQNHRTEAETTYQISLQSVLLQNSFMAAVKALYPDYYSNYYKIKRDFDEIEAIRYKAFLEEFSGYLLFLEEGGPDKIRLKGGTSPEERAAFSLFFHEALFPPLSFLEQDPLFVQYIQLGLKEKMDDFKKGLKTNSSLSLSPERINAFFIFFKFLRWKETQKKVDFPEDAQPFTAAELFHILTILLRDRVLSKLSTYNNDKYVFQ